MFDHQINVGLAMCTPIPKVPGPSGPRLAMVTTEWHRARSAISFPTNFNTINVVADGMEVGEARNTAVKLVMQQKVRPEFLAFLDYDVLPSYDCFTKLLYRARHFPQHDIFAGVYCCKSSPAEPLIYKGNGHGAFWDWKVGDLITDGVTGVHMGLTLIRTSLFERMGWDNPDKPLFLTINEKKLGPDGLQTFRGTEDLYFCDRAVKEVVARILVDTSVLAGHICHSTGKIFGLPLDSKPVLGAKWMSKNDPEYQAQKKALDLGAGATRRQWPDHATFTTDIRSDVGADYVMDTRLLNLPDNHFDLVASSHHLEHIGRWDQEQVWREMFRVTKPGGKAEHVVPSIEWAGFKLFDGQCDEHVMNVLYGAQEAHGYERTWNLHYFGYTREIARSLAEQAGYVNVQIKDWRDDAALGYNLIITADKPAASE